MRRFVLAILIALVGISLSVRAGDAKKLVLSETEKELLDLTNAQRKKKDLRPLKPAPLLFKMARAHSANMAKQQKVEHDLDDKTPFDRLKDLGYKYLTAAENIAAGRGTLDDIMKTWMESEAHRDNILDEEVTEIGLGIARDKDGLFYYTQVFGKPQ